MARRLEIRFLEFGGRRLAYTVAGAGPPLVVPAWWVSHLERDAASASYRAFWAAVGAGWSVVRYDNPGVGASDREGPPPRDVGESVALLGAVMDAAGLERATLLGLSSGGCAAVAFAARFPERVERLLLYGSFADGDAIAPVAVRAALVGAVRSHSGLGSRVLADVFLADASTEERAWFAGLQREAASPDVAADLLERIYACDVRDELAAVRAPTRVVHRREDRAIPFAQGAALAAGIAGAELVELPGRAHLPWIGDRDAAARALRGEPAPRRAAALLTAREREVLALVAAGLSEREVAARLVVSPHTVHRHVANIRTKLASPTAAAAVAEAARLGLL